MMTVLLSGMKMEFPFQANKPEKKRKPLFDRFESSTEK